MTQSNRAQIHGAPSAAKVTTRAWAPPSRCRWNATSSIKASGPQRAVDHRPAPRDHPSLLIGLEQDHDLGFAPFDPKLLPFRLTVDPDLRDHGPHPDATPVDPDGDPLVRELAAGG